MALVPLTTVSILLLTPAEERPGSASWLLALSPLVWLGDISYAVYLIHWPVFVFFLATTGREQLSLVSGSALIAVSILLAWVLTAVVDRPAQFASWADHPGLHKLLVIGLSLVAGLSSVLAARLLLERKQDAAEQQIAEQLSLEAEWAYPGARVLFEPMPVDFGSPPLPFPALLGEQWASFVDNCSGVGLTVPEELASGCSYQPTSSSYAPLVVIVGDSHAEQILVPQVGYAAQQMGMNVMAVLKGGCPLYQPLLDGSPASECDTWNADVLDYLTRLRPDYVFLISTASAPDSPEETVRNGLPEAVVRLTDAGVRVIGVRDNLRSEQNLYDCSDDRPVGFPYGGCLLARSDYFAPTNPAAELSAVSGYSNLDMTDAYCTTDWCPTIVGNVFVYLDTNHVTKDYSETVAPYFLEELEALMSAS